ncbi:MAG: mechanosensitive ion channel family protein, partial [Bacillota bacterium]
IGRIVIKKLLSAVGKMKAMGKVDPAVKSFLMNFFKIALYIVLVISIISVLGVPMASVITVLATCGLAIGMALQGALSNFAGGIMLLIFRPFGIGDLIVATDAEGVVKDINLFYTQINTLDNKVVMIPNGTLMGANITNVSKEDLRRVDLTFNLSGADIAGARKVMLEQMNAVDKILENPEPPFAQPVEGIPGGMSFAARAWVKKEDYWDVYFALMEAIPKALGEAGIGGPLPAYNIVNNQ